MKSFIEYILEDQSNVVDDKIVPIDGKDFSKVLSELSKAFNNIRDKYVKCLTVVDSLDNQAGSMSEKILAYLLTNYGENKNLTAKQVGGKQDLVDIEITLKGKKYNISLKTTASHKPIGLGLNDQSKTVVNNSNFIKFIKNNLDKINDQSISANNFVSDCLKKILPDNPEAGTAGLGSNLIAQTKKSLIEYKKSIQAKIDVIVEKLCGTDSNPEIFVWVEKKYNVRKKILTGFDFHMYRFNPDGIRDFLMKKCRLSFTKNGAFGFIYNGNSVVVADLTGKLFNITRYFIEVVQAENDKLHLRDAKIQNKTTITLIDDKDVKKIESMVSKFNQIGSDEIDRKYIEKLESIYDAVVDSSASKEQE